MMGMITKITYSLGLLINDLSDLPRFELRKVLSLPNYTKSWPRVAES